MRYIHRQFKFLFFSTKTATKIKQHMIFIIFIIFIIFSLYRPPPSLSSTPKLYGDNSSKKMWVFNFGFGFLTSIKINIIITLRNNVNVCFMFLILSLHHHRYVILFNIKLFSINYILYILYIIRKCNQKSLFLNNSKNILKKN